MEIDINQIKSYSIKNMTFIEKNGSSFAIVDKDNLLTLEEKSKIIDNYFKNNEIKLPSKDITYSSFHDPDFNFLMIQIFKKEPLYEPTQIY